MKYFKIIFLILLLPFSLNSQVEQTDIGKGVNIISKSEYLNVLINGVNISQIRIIGAKKKKLDKLFKANFVHTVFDGSSLFHTFEDKRKGLQLVFTEDSTNQGVIIQLYSYLIFNQQSSLKILGKTLRLFDSIDKLGNLKKNDKEGTLTFISNYSDDWISIKYDTKNQNKILRIEYASPL